MQNAKDFSEFVRKSSSSLGIQGRVWLAEDVLSEAEMTMLVQALRSGDIQARRIRHCGSDFLEVTAREEILAAE